MASQTSRLNTASSTIHKPPASASIIGESTTEVLEAITEEHSGTPSGTHMHAAAAKSAIDDLRKGPLECICRKFDEAIKTQRQTAEEIERLLKEKELELRAEYDKILEKEIVLMKERFNYILANEQTRAFHMLREAHRERQEKITALQSQLECKNLAALMYVMCTERRRSKLEKLRIVKEYTTYIHELQDILTDGQELILHLSRGYKTAARVDHEWREKMKKVISEFMGFIYNFAGGSPEANQYFFDMQTLLKTEAPIEDNPNEDPCELEEGEDPPVLELPPEKTWWEQLEGERRPFVMFGDMAEFTPDQRRNTLKLIKAPKTAPKKWRSYVFNQMFLNASCKNLDDIKDLYPEKTITPKHWESTQTEQKGASKMSFASRKDRQSVDTRGMGSLLKIITSANAAQSVAKTALLGAKDSMEIASTTKLARSLIRPPTDQAESDQDCDAPRVIEQPEVLVIGKRRTSVFEEDMPSEEETTHKPPQQYEDEEEEKESLFCAGHNDSLQVIPSHVPDDDPAIYYERVCPIEKCKLMQVDSFMRSLPSYMRANPFTHFEHTFDGYETCTPEQLEILQQRIASRKAKEMEEVEAGEEDPLNEWVKRGVAVQTSSDTSLSLPPCNCHVPSPTPVSSNLVFNFEDLMPVKQAMDAIHKECLYDDTIDFDRFKVIGSDSKATQQSADNEYKPVKYDEIKKILMDNPSLLDVFHPESGTPGMI